MHDDPPPPYAELHCLSNFTFLRGASHPEELVARAARLGYAALALTDECSVAGAVRAHLAAAEHGLHLIIGTELALEDGPRLVLLATDREGYGRLSHLITLARRRADKGSYHLTRADVETHPPRGCLALWLPAPSAADVDEGEARWLAERFPGAAWIAVERLLAPDDQERIERLQAVAATLNLPLCAAGDVHMHTRGRRALQDTLTAIRLGRPVAALGGALFPNGERHLRPRRRLARLYPRAWLEETARIAARCRFRLDELRYEYPGELVPEGHTPSSWLRALTRRGMRRRWPAGAPMRVRRLVAHELALIRDMGYEPYFLTVYDVVDFARRRGILCQGRGSAANSAVCYCLGITEVDPGRMQLLFERFVSRERDEPPDIDVDFEHERREEVIQYIYTKYGRGRAALAATVITYRERSAIRDVGKALGLGPDQVERIARAVQRWDDAEALRRQLTGQGLMPDGPVMRRFLALVSRLIGFPRHLSQHVGGFVISRGPLSALVPVENAAMDGRTLIQWDKDDLDALGLLKVDVLSLGMLTAVRRALDYVSAYTGERLRLGDIPPEDPEVYAMIRRADTVGVFQIESRAQMGMLPRLRPRNYYDLVIQIAIVRPGPIQGDMVHPYLRRRSGLEPVSYPGDEVRAVLERTLGVPIFQEQVMQLVMVAAGFTAGEADQMRRCMGTWRRRGGFERFRRRLMEGMAANGYPQRFAEQIYQQIQGFGEYGFPESHSASFALLAYASAWLKRHHPAAFTCALLNSQPMGFYAPAQLVRDAERHGVRVLPVDVNHSNDECSLEWNDHEVREGQPALRLGLAMVKGLSASGMEALLTARRDGPFESVAALAARAGLDRRDLERLAAAGALRPLSGDRHRAAWQVQGVAPATPLFPAPRFAETEVMLRRPREGEDIVADHAALGLSLGRHPLALLRARLAAQGYLTAGELWDQPDGAPAKTAGLVICRQRPLSAHGVVFVTLEDESGQTNLVVWQHLAERRRRALLSAQLMAVTGTIQKQDGVLHVVAQQLEDLSEWLGALVTPSRDFC